MPLSRGEEARIVGDRLVDGEVGRVGAGEEAVDAERREQSRAVVAEPDLVAVGGVDAERAVGGDRGGAGSTGERRVDLRGELVERGRVRVDRDEHGGALAGRLVGHMDLERSVADVEGNARGVGGEVRGRVVDGIQPGDRRVSAQALRLRVDAVHLEGELAGERVEVRDRGVDGVGPLAEERADLAAVGREGGAVGLHAQRDGGAVAARLGAQRDAARLAGEDDGDGADEHIERAVGLLDGADRDVLRDLVDEHVAAVAQRVRVAAGAALLGLDDLTVDLGDLVEQPVDGADGRAERAVDLGPDIGVLGAELADRGREPAALLDDDGAHGLVGRVVRELAEAVEERAQAAREVLVGELVADGLDRVEEALVDLGRVLVADRGAGAALQRDIDGALDARELHAGADESAAADVLGAARREPGDLAVVARGRGVRHVVAGDLDRRLAGEDRGLSDLECAVDAHVGGSREGAGGGGGRWIGGSG